MKRIGRLVFAVAIMGPSALAAQGAKETSARAWVVEPAPAPPAEPLVSHAQPARGILATLVGTWRFEIRFAGNYGGAPDAAGTRVMHALFDDLRVEWTEALDHSPLAGQGMTGVLDDAQPTIAFRPVAGDEATAPATLTVVDDDHFTWVAPDHGWRAVFTRQR
ncbi:MAG: hypothetical protein DMD46_09195 [Gemmatimonadetes bacterium]|nr:MAG: hypothetical protein DMD46_09195 [Gemmatimonadota bacterium]